MVIGLELGAGVGLGLEAGLLSCWVFTTALMAAVIAEVIGLLGSEAIAKATLICSNSSTLIKDTKKPESSTFNFISLIVYQTIGLVSNSYRSEFVWGIQIQWPGLSSGPPVDGGWFKLAEGVATLGMGDVQAPESPVWPIFLLIKPKSNALMIPSLLKSAFSFQFEDCEVAARAFWAME